MTADVLIAAPGRPGQIMWNTLRNKDFRRLDAHIVSVDDDASDASFDERNHRWTLGTLSARVLVADRWPRGVDDGTPAYLGLARHAVPNYFVVDEVEARARYIAECVAALLADGCARIEVRRSTQRVFNDRGARTPDWTRARKHIPSAFEIWTPDDDSGVYDGPATVTAADTELTMRARLTGHLDPIDGRYHWQGMLFGDLPRDVVKSRSVTLTVDGRGAAARVGELTPWGHHSVSGVGAPPFAI